MDMSISTYYYKSNGKRSGEDQLLLGKIEEIIEKLPACGYRKLTSLLHKEGLQVNHKRVYRIMRQNGLLYRKKRRRRSYTTDTSHKLRRYPNLLAQIGGVHAPAQALVGDVTAYDVKGRTYYAASLMDLYSRRVLGCAVSSRNNTALVIEALKQAKGNRGSLEGCIHHTDSDVRYCSYAYVSLLSSYGMRISMCVGNAYENAYAESWNATLKREEIGINEYGSGFASAEGIFSYVKKYNEYRSHASLSNQSPMEFEENFNKCNNRVHLWNEKLEMRNEKTVPVLRG